MNPLQQVGKEREHGTHERFCNIPRTLLNAMKFSSEQTGNFKPPSSYLAGQRYVYFMLFVALIFKDFQDFFGLPVCRPSAGVP